MNKEFAHERDAGRYVMRIDGELVSTVDYTTTDSAISLTRVYTAPTHRGRGLAAEIVEHTVDDIEATTQLRIVPMCWYAGLWFDEHPERAGLLTR